MIRLFKKPLFNAFPGAVLATGLLLLMGVWGCQEPSVEEELEENTSVTVDEAVARNEGDHELASDYLWESGSEVSIVLSDGAIVENSDQVKVSGNKVTITAAGNYRLTGKLSDGQVVVEAPSAALVRLILAGVTYAVWNLLSFGRHDESCDGGATPRSRTHKGDRKGR